MGIVTNYYVPEFGMNTYYLCRGLGRLGVDVTLFASNKYGQKKPTSKFNHGELDEPFKVVRVPTLFSFANVPIMTGLKEELERNHFDILQTEDAYQIYSYTAAVFAKDNDIPLVLRHDLSDRPKIFPYNLAFRFIEQFVSKKIVSYSRNAIVPTREAKEYLLHLRPTLPIEMIPFGIDTDRFRPTEMPRKTDSFEVLTVARLVQSKGLDDLLCAISEVRKTIKRVHLTIVGRGPLKQHLMEYAEDLKISDTISFVDFVPHDKMQEVYNGCDVFVLPSYEEAMNLSCMEAMSCQKPVVATNIAGIRDTIDSGIDGILVEPHDRNGLADSIIKIFQDSRLASRLATNAHYKILHNYSWDKICKEMISVYNQCLG